jgi:hypothetical protein
MDGWGIERGKSIGVQRGFLWGKEDLCEDRGTLVLAGKWYFCSVLRVLHKKSGEGGGRKWFRPLWLGLEAWS